MPLDFETSSKFNECLDWFCTADISWKKHKVNKYISIIAHISNSHVVPGSFREFCIFLYAKQIDLSSKPVQILNNSTRDSWVPNAATTLYATTTYRLDICLRPISSEFYLLNIFFSFINILDQIHYCSYQVLPMSLNTTEIYSWGGQGNF